VDVYVTHRGWVLKFYGQFYFHECDCGGCFIALKTMFVTFVACYDVNDGCKFNIDDRLVCVCVCGGRDKR
jgi:hypothetical protein